MNKKSFLIVLSLLIFSGSALVVTTQAYSNNLSSRLKARFRDTRNSKNKNPQSVGTQSRTVQGRDCYAALDQCMAEASILYPYDGRLIDPTDPPPSYQAQQYCHYLFLRCLGGNPRDSGTTDITMMEQLQLIFDAHLTGAGTGTIGNTYLQCMEIVGDAGYCRALFPDTAPGLELRKPLKTKPRVGKIKNVEDFLQGGGGLPAGRERWRGGALRQPPIRQ